MDGDDSYTHRTRIATLTGRPYSVQSDTWEPKPSLGFEALADAVAKVIVTSVPQLTLAVYGPWGSGKTTLLHAVDLRVRSSTCPVIWFDMWEHKDRPDVIPYLLAAIADGLPGDPDLKKRLLAFARVALASATLSAGQVSFSGDAFLKQLDKMWEEAPPLGRERLADVIRSWREQTTTDGSFLTGLSRASRFTDSFGIQPRIVIVIDNLDRCLPRQAVKMLEQTSSLFDFEGVVFLLAAEHERLASAIEVTYELPDGAKEGARYLEKLIQVDFTVPSPDPTQTRSWVEAELSDPHLPLNEGDIELVADVAHANPRRIKRLLNNVRMQLCAARPEFARRQALVLSSALLLETNLDAWRTLTSDSKTRMDVHSRVAAQQGQTSLVDTYGALVLRILQSQGGRELLALQDDQMSRFLTSAETTLAVSDEQEVKEVVEQARSNPTTQQRDAAILYSDGGIGIAGAFALAGALAVLEEDGWQPYEQAGAGGGALIAMLRASGYTAVDIAQILDSTDFAILFRRKRLFVPFTFGPRTGEDPVERWVAALLDGRGVKSFADLGQKRIPATLIATWDPVQKEVRVLPPSTPPAPDTAEAAQIAPLVALGLRVAPPIKLTPDALAGRGLPERRTFILGIKREKESESPEGDPDVIDIVIGKTETDPMALTPADRRSLALSGREAAQVAIQRGSQPGSGP